MIASADRLHALARGFERAAAAQPAELVEQAFSVVGHPVLARVAGRSLAARALAPWDHLREPRVFAASPALAIELWDENATGIPFDGPATDAGVQLGTADARVVLQAALGSLSAIDRETRRAVGWRRAADGLPVEERWRVLPSLLPLWCIDRGVNVIHAGLVADGEDGVLVAGAGGAGKSTTTLACAAAGMNFLGDDQVGLAERDGAFYGHSLYASARLTAQTLARHPELTLDGRVEEPGDGKVLLFPGARARIERQARIRAVMLPRLADGPASLARASPGEALRAFAPTSLINAVGGGRWAFERLSRLVRTVPAFSLDLAGSPGEAVVLVRRALDEARDGAAT